MKRVRVAMAFLLVLVAGVIYADDTKARLEIAYFNYHKGEIATTAEERSDAFNRALGAYTALEADYPHPKLFFNIGNCYYQVGEYPWAILYYYRAQLLLPRDERVSLNLSLAQKKLGIIPAEAPSAFQQIFFLHYRLSMPERLQLFAFFGMMTIALGFMAIWLERRVFWKLSWGTIACSVLLLMSLALSQYFSKVEAVLVRGSSLYRDAGKQYATVVADPIRSGEKVEVIEVINEGKWLKIVTPKGDMGFVSSEVIRII